MVLIKLMSNLSQRIIRLKKKLLIVKTKSSSSNTDY